MRNLTYTLSPHPRSLRSLTPKKGKGRLTDLSQLSIFNLMAFLLLMV